ncbi:MAG: AmmeMemoRadiSam system protein B [Rhodospirillales bacterium]
MNAVMSEVRPAAVAGMFYPQAASDLRDEIAGLLAEAAPRVATGPVPKAIIAPHAGYIYSGAVAASAYARLVPAGEQTRRVVVIGPAHRLAFRGLAVPGTEAFATPLGVVPVDKEAIQRIASLPDVQVLDAAHADEHAIEVHLPFLQTLFADFSLVPIVVGDAAPDSVARLLDALWGGDETAIVISSDLSHYLPYDRANAVDARTSRAIESLDGRAIGYEQACGRLPVAGLLAVAKRRGLSVSRLDLRNSGDTAGGRTRVVGYGAWAFEEPVGA